MASTIVTKNSSTASAVPLTGDLTQGELAVNVTDKRLFTKNSGGTVVELGTNPASLALPNGTANGVAYLNGSKVVTTGSALTFDGTNLGVGTTSAGKNIAIYSSSNGNNGLLRLFDLGGTERLQLAGSSTGEAVYYSPAGSVHAWYINSEQMRLTSTGLGIGTSSPLGTLGIAGSATTTIVIPRSSNGTTGTPVETQLIGSTFTNGSYGAGIYALNAFNSTSENWLTFKTTAAGNGSPVERMRLDSSGNLGLGTTSPAGRVDVNSTAGEVIYSSSDRSTNGQYISGLIQRAKNSSSSYVSYAAIYGSITSNTASSEAGALTFWTMGSGSVAERARITSSGNLLVGTTSQVNTTLVSIKAPSSANVLGLQNSNDSNYLITALNSSGTEVFRVAGNGNVVNTNNSYGGISDAKLKENIVDATPKLSDLMQVRVRNYNLKSDPDHKQIGVIAQELEQIFPGMVEKTSDRDAEGNDLGTTTKNVKYSVFVPMLIKAIQEQQALITQLQADVAALKGN